MCVENVLTVAEAAALLRVPESRVRFFVRRGLLRATLKGRQYLIARADLVRFRVPVHAPGEPGRPYRDIAPVRA